MIRLRAMLLKRLGNNTKIIENFESHVKFHSNNVSPFKIKVIIIITIIIIIHYHYHYHYQRPYKFKPLSSPLSQMVEIKIEDIDTNLTNDKNCYIKLKIASTLLFRSDRNAIKCVAIDKDDDLSFITFSNLERTFDKDMISKLFAKGNDIIIINPTSGLGMDDDEIHVTDPNDIIHNELLPLSNEEIYQMKKTLSSLSTPSSPATASPSSSSSSSPSTSTSSPSTSSPPASKKRVFCTSNGCRKEGSFLCPKCRSKGKLSYFCSQACFQTNYDSHKATHKKL